MVQYRFKKLHNFDSCLLKERSKYQCDDEPKYFGVIILTAYHYILTFQMCVC
jgi:hypothetical protein